VQNIVREELRTSSKKEWKQDEETIRNARKKEKWYYENMMLQESTSDGYIVDGDWIDCWMDFILKG
jgi:hypothetical protein